MSHTFSERVRAADHPAPTALTTVSTTLLRLSLAVTYIWFGALKLIGRSPVADIVAQTTPILPKNQIVPLVGGMEVAIGIGLLGRVALPFTLFLMLGHIATTFLVFVRLPYRTFQENNPLLLTKEGEFVLKNLVIASAALVIASTIKPRRRRVRAQYSPE
jgi:uncharacterized membrane protein YkgB